MLFSDGFARAVWPYGIYSDYEALYGAVKTRGASSVLHKMRAFEKRGTDIMSHYKKMDDASVLVVRV